MSEGKMRLHYWYINKEEYHGKEYVRAHGNVTGHSRFEDSTFINTSYVTEILLNEPDQELIVRTKNSVYHCPLDSCAFDRQDPWAELVPDYEEIRRQYKDKDGEIVEEPGQILLVLSDFDEYYYHSISCRPERDAEQLRFQAYAHTGMMQDSFLMNTFDEKIDIRYFPHPGSIEFYLRETCGMPLYIKNIGSSVLYVTEGSLKVRLEPGQRKEFSAENQDPEAPPLSGRDLYPADWS